MRAEPKKTIVSVSCCGRETSRTVGTAPSTRPVCAEVALRSRLGTQVSRGLRAPVPSLEEDQTSHGPACPETSATAWRSLQAPVPVWRGFRHRTALRVRKRAQLLGEACRHQPQSGLEKIRHRISLYMSRNERNCLDLLGCFSLRRALASICRIRSRVTANFLPTSSNV